MDILPDDVLKMVIVSFKILLAFVASLVTLVSYFQAKEARKMEHKLQIAIPGSISIAMSMHFAVSLVFLAVSVLLFML